MKSETAERKDPVRTDRLLRQKYTQYIIPAVITYAALSLNEFVDSMLVSNLLDSDALAIVTLGAPVVMVCTATYSLLGIGGANLYAVSLGKRDHGAAGRSLTASCVTSSAAGIVLMIAGLIFCGPLTDYLCKTPGLREDFRTYLYVLILAAPLEILVLTVTAFLPSAGHPGASTAVNVIANVINIGMDYVYIRIFHMGVEGAAWATLTGYICGALFMAVLLAAGKIKLYFSRDIKGSMASLGEITKLGRPDAINQIGLSIQYAVCNRLAAIYAGANGLVAYSICLQTGSVISIFVASVIGTSVTMMAVLRGQQDYQGERHVLGTAFANQLTVCAAGMILAELFAARIAGLYNVTDPEQLALSVHAMRIFAFMYIPRYAVIVYYCYLKVIGFSRYSSVMSALDSFAAVIPAAWILTGLLGIDGLWYTFPAVAILLIVLMLIVNRRYAAESGGRLSYPLLMEHEGEGESRTILDVTISRDSKDIEYISRKIQELCEEAGLSRSDAVKAGLAAEEFAVYVANRKRQSTYADVLVRLRNGNVEIDFRSLGEVFDPRSDEESDIKENVKILRSIASSIENEYVLGMNSTRIVIESRSREHKESTTEK